jgi:hypothetical protein
VKQLGVQSTLHTPYSFIDFIGFVAMINATRFPISKPFLVAKSIIYGYKHSAAVGQLAHGCPWELNDIG